MQKVTLLKALQLVKPGLASKEMIEQSTSFAFMDNRIVTYNDEISISHPIPDLGIQGAIKADKLYGFLDKLTKDEIEIQSDGNQLIVKSGRSKAGLAIQQEIRLPLEEIPEVDKWTPVPDKLLDALKFTVLSCSNDMSRPILTCVHVNKKGRVESCDNYRMSVYELGTELPDTFLIPADSVKELIKFKPDQMAVTEAWAHFKTEAGTVFSCRIFNDTYPDISPLLDVQGVDIQLPKSLDKVLDRASIFSKQDHLLDEQIQVTLAANRLKVRAESDASWFEETTNVKYAGEPVTIGIHPTMLRQIIQQTKTSVLGTHGIKFQGPDWCHVIALIVNPEG